MAPEPLEQLESQQDTVGYPSCQSHTGQNVDNTHPASHHPQRQGPALDRRPASPPASLPPEESRGVAPSSLPAYKAPRTHLNGHTRVAKKAGKAALAPLSVTGEGGKISAECPHPAQKVWKSRRGKAKEGLRQSRPSTRLGNDLQELGWPWVWLYNLFAVWAWDLTLDLSLSILSKVEMLLTLSAATERIK